MLHEVNVVLKEHPWERVNIDGDGENEWRRRVERKRESDLKVRRGALFLFGVRGDRERESEGGESA